MSIIRRALLAGLLLAGPALGQAVRNGPLPPPLPLFPPDNWWNVDVSAAPIAGNSTALLNASIASNVGLHPDFGGDAPDFPEIYGMPYVSVPGSQPLLPVAFVEFGDQSDAGVPGRPAGYPVPEEAKAQAKWIEGGHPGNVDPGGDRHLLIVDRDNRLLYELYRAFWNAGLGRWEASSAAVFSLAGNNRRPETWTSADAAGLAILPGLVRYDEAFGAGPIRHAFRVTVHPTTGYVHPASHDATTGANALPLGARLRLKPGVFPAIPGGATAAEAAAIQRIAQAMKTYGLVVADNGSDLYVQGTYDPRWNNDVLNPAFASLRRDDFEVVQLGWRPTAGTSAPDLDLFTLPPCRVLDTRDPFGPWGAPALFPGWHRVVRMAGRCGIPATAKAVSVNVTVTGAGAAGHLVFFPGDADGGSASTINFTAGVTRANNAVLMLASSGSGTLAVHHASAAAGLVHLLIDVNGYFQ
ncbi:MAG TPA: hypothetical protein VF121_13630 [Thermoanaerobaculia bacterium]|nr:hypothetical protein [Thermoanaerobaculia bacterium]